MSTPRTLDQWVDYIQTLHFREIDLGLDRVNQVYQRLLPDGVDFTVISIAGTNGKGSTAELLSSIFTASGYTTAKFTSPHLIDYRERFSIGGKFVSEQQLLAAFERVESVRGEIPLTYFEFGTLMAIELFATANVDIACMEVGLGGRLDAVNILDADISIITSISIDHTAWLGNTIDEIAPEKMGIARRGRPCIVGLPELSNKMQLTVDEIGMQLEQINEEFCYQYTTGDTSWNYRSDSLTLTELPLPFSQSGAQLSNASLALRAIELLAKQFPVSPNSLRQGIGDAQLFGRCQIIDTQPYVILDVAHNESSVALLAQFLDSLNARRYIAVCGMLKDKEISKSLACLSDKIDQWHLATINSERGATAQQLQEILQQELFLAPDKTHCYENVTQAYINARQSTSEHDVLVVFGSFFIAGDILALLGDDELL